MGAPYLLREDAPFSSELWKLLDEACMNAAREELSGRRFLPLRGPFGLGLAFVPLSVQSLEEGVSALEGKPLLALERTFHLKKLDIAQFERNGISLDLAPLVKVAKEVARLEERLIFEGLGGQSGLCTHPSACSSSLSVWDKPGKAVEDIIGALSILDREGFHGPFALALSVERYNLLFRNYPGTGHTELEHIRSIVGDRVVKSPVLREGGVLLAVNPMYAEIVLGQDLQIGFIGPEEEGYRFSVSESLALLLREPRSVCILK
jgi:uncharacterized linocin/CFP29 family protein